MYIHGEVNEFGYEIIDNHTGEVIYWAGNSPRDSKVVIRGLGKLSVSTLIKYCNQTGNEIAAEQGKLYVGIE